MAALAWPSRFRRGDRHGRARAEPDARAGQGLGGRARRRAQARRFSAARMAERSGRAALSPSRAVGDRRSGARPALALAAGRLRLRHRRLLHGAARARLVGGRCRRARRRGGRLPRAPQRHRLSSGARGCRGRCRLRHRHVEDPCHRPSAPRLSDLARACGRLRRDARRARAQRPYRRARGAHRGAAHARETAARARRGAQRQRACGRALRRLQGASCPAAAAFAARRLRLCARPLFPGDRRLRVRPGQGRERTAAACA